MPAWLHTDRADPLFREPPRRLDRLDLAIVVGLVLLAFAFRLWRLDIPRAQHFDEVYHGRSATECQSGLHVEAVVDAGIQTRQTRFLGQRFEHTSLARKRGRQHRRR